MIKKVVISLSFMVLSLFACDDEVPISDLSGDQYIRGRLMLSDTFLQQVQNSPLAKKKVTISYANSNDFENYLLSTLTDDEGYFEFQNLQKDTNYRLSYKEDINDTIFTAQKEVIAPNDTTLLKASIATDLQSGLHLTVVDPNGEKINGVDVCVFTNQLLYDVGNCENSDFKLKTNAGGRAFKLGVMPGDYFIKGTIKIGEIDYLVKKSITVNNHIKFDTLKLEKVVPNLVGFQYLVFDATGTKVSGVNLCIFTSRVVFNSKNCSGSTYQIITDSKGIASKYGLDPGKYFVYSYIVADSLTNLTYENLDSVMVEEKNITYKEVVLKERQE